MGCQSVGVDRTPTARAVCGSPLSACQCPNPRRHEPRAPERERVMGAVPQRPLPLALLKAPQSEPGQSSHTHLPKDRFDGVAPQPVESLPETGQRLPLHPVSGRGVFGDASPGTSLVSKRLALLPSRSISLRISDINRVRLPSATQSVIAGGIRSICSCAYDRQ